MTRISIISETGAVYEADDAFPRAQLPDNTGVRLRVRFVQADESLPTYAGLADAYANYTAVVAAYDNYSEIRLDSGLAVDADFDITCYLTGATVVEGRNGPFDDVDARTLNVSLYDRYGFFDPRWEDTVFGPGRRIRTGTWIRLELWRASSGWHPIFTGLTDAWTRDILPGEDGDVRIVATDFSTGLATANISGGLAEETTSERIQSLLAAFWQSTWGNTIVATDGDTELYAEVAVGNDETALPKINAAAQVDDGRVYIDGAGDFHYETSGWRDGRQAKVVVLGRGADEFEASLELCTYETVADTIAEYDAVDDVFLVYDDMALCSGVAAPVPRACATRIEAADVADNVVNEVILEYTPGGPGGGASDDTIKYVAANSVSIERYGQRSFTNSDLTPKTPTMLNALALTLVDRWKSGDATITGFSVDLLRENRGLDALLDLQAGDVVYVVDQIPAAIGSTRQWEISTSEVMQTRWGIGPDTFTLDVTLDQLRIGQPATTEGAMLYDLDRPEQAVHT